MNFKGIIAAMVGVCALASCNNQKSNEAMENPFLSESTLVHGAFPFDKLKVEHYKPAFIEGIKQHDAEIDAIVNNPEEPTYENTIEALDKAGKLLNRVGSIFYNLVECDGTDDMLALSEEIQPMMSEHSLNVSLNEKLFQRVEAVYNKYKDDETLTVEQKRLLKDNYDGYVRSGATLKGEAREEWRQIASQLDSLTLSFGQNVQKATADWSYELNPETDLEGLPSFVSELLKGNGYKLSLNATVYGPFMKYSSKRDLREMLYKAYNSRCYGGKYDNTENIRLIATLRQRRAELLGYATFADFQLENKMAKTPENVNALLNNLLNNYKKPADAEVREVAALAAKDGVINLMPWDFSYYSERLKMEKYNVSDAEVKPYFPLEKVKDGVFGLATRLYGVTFNKIDVPVYNESAECFEVLDGDGSYLGLLYTDFMPRDTKRPGAWMTEFKGQWLEKTTVDGVETVSDSRPHIQIVMSFSKAIGNPGEEGYIPALLTYDEVSTFLHEFGHSLHGLLTKCTYASTSGTSVARDFVELPSQFNENFLRKKEFLDTFAENYETGEKIPVELINKLLNASNYLAAYSCVRQLSFGMVDMAFHSIGKQVAGDINSELNIKYPQLQDVEKFETEAMAATQVLPRVEGTMMVPSFTHIFSGGYAAGYYGYKWAEVLDADAFAVFENEGIFNPETAKRFRVILESGDSVAPDELFRNFKGSDPDIKALMKRDGIIK